jgi:hypothetical protein
MYSPGYVVPLLPLWALLGAAEIDFLIRQVEAVLSRPPTQLIGAISALALIAILLLPYAVDTVANDWLELDEALALVRSSIQPDDIVLAASPAAAFIELGRVDYFAQHNAALLDEATGRTGMWLGTPAIDSVEELAKILGNNKRVWLVVDKEGWKRHYLPEYHDLVAKQMRMAGESIGMLVFISGQ